MQIRNKAIDDRNRRYQQTRDKDIHRRWPTAVVDCQANVMHSDANDAILFSQGNTWSTERQLSTKGSMQNNGRDRTSVYLTVMLSKG
jgi:hypothetical protein